MKFQNRKQIAEMPNNIEINTIIWIKEIVSRMNIIDDSDQRVRGNKMIEALRGKIGLTKKITTQIKLERLKEEESCDFKVVIFMWV